MIYIYSRYQIIDLCKITDMVTGFVLACRFRRRDLLGGQLMSRVLRITMNYFPKLNACLDSRDFLTTQEDPGGNWCMLISRMMFSLSEMIRGSKFCFLYLNAQLILSFSVFLESETGNLTYTFENYLK